MRKSIVIGVPSFGTVGLRWAQNYRALATPMNSLCPCISEVGFPVDVARNRIVEIMLGLECRPTHIFWLDDDVVCHPFAMLQLLEAKKDIIAGVYFTKDEFSEPLIFGEKCGGSIPYDPRIGVVERWGCGSGLTLVKTDVYREMLDLDLGKDDKGNHRWYYTSGDKPDETYRCTEDLWFCERAQEAGFKIHVDHSMKAFGWHVNPANDQGYPKPQWEQYLKEGKADWKVPDEPAKRKRKQKKA